MSNGRGKMRRVIEIARLALISLAAVLSISAACEVKSTITPETMRPEKVVIGYYPAWVKDVFTHLDVNYQYLTHIAHAFAWPEADGDLYLPPGFLYPELNSAGHAAGVKMILSLGGWGNSAGFPGMASTVENRTRFIGQVVAFLRQNAYDGVDLDWEFVSNDLEKENFSLLVEELSAALRSVSPPLLLTMAAPSGGYWARWIDFERLIEKFDFIGIMTYDYHGQWSDYSGHNSPLYSCGDTAGSFDASFHYFKSRGIPLGKLLLGQPFFGRSFDCGGFGQPFTVSDYYPYSEIVKLTEADWTFNWDACAQVPFALRRDGTKIISYDDPRSVSLKCQYVKDAGAAGLIIWELSLDGYEGSHELLETLGKSFGVR